jgi:hypothetical protein
MHDLAISAIKQPNLIVMAFINYLNENVMNQWYKER